MSASHSSSNRAPAGPDPFAEGAFSKQPVTASTPPDDRRVDPKYVVIFAKLLKHMYAAQAADRYEATKLAYDLAQETPPPVDARETALKEATQEAKKINPKYDRFDATRMLEAHQLLEEGCRKNDINKTTEAFQKLKEIHLNKDHVTAFLEVRMEGSSADSDFFILGFLGYASKYNHLKVLKNLFENGANPNSKPILQPKKGDSVGAYTYDVTPIFFSVVTHATHWTDYRDSQSTGVSKKLIPLNDCIEKIELYLKHGFDLTLTSGELNVLQYAYHANSTGDMKHNVHLLAHSIAELAKLSSKEESPTPVQRHFKAFAAKLKETNLLQAFPVLIEEYKKLPEEKEEKHLADPEEMPDKDMSHSRDYYCLRSFLFNLISLCEYANFRISQGALETIAANSVVKTVANLFPPQMQGMFPFLEKQKRLGDLLIDLKKLQTEYIQYNASKDYATLAQALRTMKEAAITIFKIQRPGLHLVTDLIFGDDGPISGPEMKKFLEKNELELRTLEAFSATKTRGYDLKTLMGRSGGKTS